MKVFFRHEGVDRDCLRRKATLHNGSEEAAEDRAVDEHKEDESVHIEFEMKFRLAHCH